MIRTMKRVLLAGRAAERAAVVAALADTALVHVEPVAAAPPDCPQEIAGMLRDCDAALAALTRHAEEAACAIAPMGAQPEDPRLAVNCILAHSGRMDVYKKRLALLEQEAERVRPWGRIGIAEIAVLAEAGVQVAFLKGPEAEADGIAAESLALLRREEGGGIYMAASRGEISAPASFARLEPPARELAAVEEEIGWVKAAIERTCAGLNCCYDRLDTIERHRLALLDRRRFAEVENGSLDAGDLFVLSGYVPDDAAGELAAAFDRAGLKVALHFEEPADEEIPPTETANAPWAESIRPLYEFMGVVPSYREPDIAPLFLVMLSVFAAFLIADAGYGLVALAAIALAWKPARAAGADPRALRLLVFLMGATTLYGLATNTWFGETFLLIPAWTFDSNSPEGMVLLQGICFLMGVVHLTVAHAMKALRGRIGLRTLSDLGWVLFLWGMYGVICMLILKRDFVMPGAFTMPLFYASALLILLFTEPSWNPLKSLAAGAGAILQNASNCFSDIVSYIRLWAVGLAGCKVAGAFNEIAAMLPFLARIPVYLAGHGMNLILGAIAVLAHGVRLNLLEFSNHLELEWAGRKYEPFRKIGNDQPSEGA